MSNDAAQAANGTPNSRRDTALEEAIEQIRRALQGLQFGEVSVIVQDGVVVQLERRERRRLRGVQR
ncbi:MAG TPA: YezD family protein [Pirellulales bacterium]|nr:YezD family protein [Pirellulales bacterium]